MQDGHVNKCKECNKKDVTENRNAKLDKIKPPTGGFLFWYDPSDLSTLFQDSAGTVPVTGVGQAVGCMLDKSGNDVHMYQGTTASKPLLQQTTGGSYYLDFDGTDDYLQANKAVLYNTRNNVLCSVALSSNNTVMDRRFFCERAASGTAALYHILQGASNVLNGYGTMIRGSDNIIVLERLKIGTLDYPQDTTMVVRVEDTAGSSVSIYKDGTYDGNKTYSGRPTMTMAVTQLGSGHAIGGAIVAFRAKFFGLVALTGTGGFSTGSQIDTWLAKKMV